MIHSSTLQRCGSIPIIESSLSRDDGRRRCTPCIGLGRSTRAARAKAPDPVSLPRRGGLRGTRWITVNEGQWHCDQAFTTQRRSTVERWFRGAIESTEVPITGSVEGEVPGGELRWGREVRRAREIDADRCRGQHADLHQPRGAQALESGWQSRRDPARHGASPQSAMILLVGLAAIALLGIGFAAYYLMLMIRSRERHSAPLPSMEPHSAALSLRSSRAKEGSRAVGLRSQPAFQKRAAADRAQPGFRRSDAEPSHARRRPRLDRDRRCPVRGGRPAPQPTPAPGLRCSREWR